MQFALQKQLLVNLRQN